MVPKQFLEIADARRLRPRSFLRLALSARREAESRFRAESSALQGRCVLLARANFGCGSSREHAPWAILDYGFRAILAPSYADIFYNNCFKNGILPVTLSNEQMDELFKRTEQNEGYRLTVDLEEAGGHRRQRAELFVHHRSLPPRVPAERARRHRPHARPRTGHFRLRAEESPPSRNVRPRRREISQAAPTQLTRRSTCIRAEFTQIALLRTGATIGSGDSGAIGAAPFSSARHDSQGESTPRRKALARRVVRARRSTP